MKAALGCGLSALGYCLLIRQDEQDEQDVVVASILFILSNEPRAES